MNQLTTTSEPGPPMPENLRAIIAANIAELRKSRSMTQQDLAARLNYTDKAISKWERGESVPDIIVLKQIADMFGVTVDYLLTGQPSPNEQDTVAGAVDSLLNNADTRLDARAKRPLSREELAVIFAALLMDT